MESALTSAFGVDSQLIEDRTYYLVECDGDAAGCGGWSYRRTLFGGDQVAVRDSEVIDPADGAAKIRAFFVHPRFARQGIGSLILRECEAEAWGRGYRKLELMSTLPGLAFYQRHGFVAGSGIRYELEPGLHIKFVPMTKNLTAYPPR